MSKDLDKMMEKLKKTKKKEETPKEDPVDEEEDQDDDEEDEEEDQEETPKEKAKKENPTEDQEVSIEQEVAILQNDGIFRRELLGALREVINVTTVNAQALIELNKLIGGLANGKKK